MKTIDELPIGARIEFLKFDDWKRYADAMGYWAYEPAQRAGRYRMQRHLGKLADIPPPPDFSFDIVGD